MTVPGELFAYFLVEDPSVEALPLPVVSNDRLAVVRGAPPNELTYYASALSIAGTTALAIQVVTPSDGDTVAMNDGPGAIYVNTGALAALTVKLPSGVAVGEIAEIGFAAPVGTLTVQDASAVAVATAPTSGFGPGAAQQYRYLDVIGWVLWK
jgi:hypothetical protein